jgi:hypothetical protein
MTIFCDATQNVGHMWKKSSKKTYQVVYKSSFKYFLDFVNLKQNVNAQHCMHVKNHNHHTNYFYLQLLNFLKLNLPHVIIFIYR